MAETLVDSVNAASATSAADVNVGLAAPTAGNLLVVYTHHRLATTGAAITGAGTWTKLFERNVLTGDATYRRAMAMFAKISDGTETTINVNWGAGASNLAISEEWAPDTGYEWDAVSGAVSASNDNGSSGVDIESIATGTTASISTTKNLILAGCGFKQSIATTYTGSSWATISMTASEFRDSTVPSSGSNHIAAASAYLASVATGTKASTGTITGDANDIRGATAGIAVFSQSLASYYYGVPDAAASYIDGVPAAASGYVDGVPGTDASYIDGVPAAGPALVSGVPSAESDYIHGA